MAPCPKTGKFGWIRVLQFQLCKPCVRNRCGRSIKRLPQLADDVGQRIGEILVFSRTKLVFLHNNTISKQRLIFREFLEFFALMLR